MAFLRRIHSLKTPSPSPSPSLLHHLSSTSNSAAGDHPSSNPTFSTFPSPSSFISKQAMPNPPLLFTPSSPSLLRHHHRLLSTSTSATTADPNSPALLRELSEAINQLSSSLYNCDLASSTFPSPPSFNSKQPHQTMLEQLKVKVWRLRHKQTIHHQRVWEMDESRIAWRDEARKKLAEFLVPLEEHMYRGTVAPPETHARWRKELDTCIASSKRLKEMTVEFVQLSHELTNSRLVSLYEIVEDLSKIREIVQDDEVWNELNEGLMKGKEMELKEAVVVAEKIKHQLAYVEYRINAICELRRKF